MDFEKRMREQLNDYESFAQSTRIETSIRLNPHKKFNHLHSDRIPWCENGFYLESRPHFASDPLWHAGAYYVQEASSMFLEKAIQKVVHSPVLALDLCAAPGGKSTHLLSLLPPGSLLVCNEVIHSRLPPLRENIIKWGNPDVVITHSDPARFASLKGMFDLLVTDAPCSGEGLFRKDPAARREWSPQQVQLCASRQRRILQDSWPALKTGGHLIYSTCTFAPEECEENIAWFCEEFGAQCIPLPCHWNIEEVRLKSSIGYRFYPHRLRGEGFFMAVLKKTDIVEADSYRSFDKYSRQTTPDWMKTLKSRLISDEHHVLINTAETNTRNNPGRKGGDHRRSNEGSGEEIKLFSNQWTEEFQLLKKYVSVIDFGLAVCAVKKGKLIPDPALAFSRVLNAENFYQIKTDAEQARKYLRKESLTTDAPIGYALITYQNIPLGWINNLGNRSNNLYPVEWRLRIKN